MTTPLHMTRLNRSDNLRALPADSRIRIKVYFRFVGIPFSNRPPTMHSLTLPQKG